MDRALLTAALVASLAPTLARAMPHPPATPLPSGVYHCKAGSSRMMLTLGDMTISGARYVFKDPVGGSTKGIWSAGGTSYNWSGDIGAVKHAQIVESGHDASGDAFYFTYRARPTSLPTTASCAM